MLFQWPQLEVNSKQMQATSEIFFQSENYQYMEQVASQWRGGFLPQLLQEMTGVRMWNYKRHLHPLLLQATSYRDTKKMRSGSADQIVIGQF